MSSTRHRLYFSALALIGGLAACDAAVNGGSAFKGTQPSNENAGFDSPSYVPSDAAAAERSLLASPLCGFTQASPCFPDDDGMAASSVPPTSKRCPDVADAGTEDGGTTSLPACRVGKDPSKLDNADGHESTSAAYVPQCTVGDLAGTDGVTCNGSSDCAPGFECVAGEKGAFCRRYCCAGSCEQQASANAGATFCDVQTLADDSTHKAPVCMPLKSCKLFVDGDCGADETCAVVTETGANGCVAKGNAKAGEPCDADHCQGGLTCLGSPGDRRCYKLCRIDGADCAPTETCTPGSIFHDMAFGVCQAQ